MTIYQLHEYSGEWEDFYDCIIGSYLRKERAEEEKAKAEEREKELAKHGERCMRCLFLEERWGDINKLLSEHPNYCAEAELVAGDRGIDCENYYSHFDESYFEIKEVEVEE